MEPWQIVALIAVVLMIGIIGYSAYEMRWWARQKKDEVEDETLAQIIAKPEAFAPDFDNVDDIHAYYAMMKESDPKRAGQLMYKAQTRLHEQGK